MAKECTGHLMITAAHETEHQNQHGVKRWPDPDFPTRPTLKMARRWTLKSFLPYDSITAACGIKLCSTLY